MLMPVDVAEALLYVKLVMVIEDNLGQRVVNCRCL